MSNTNLNLSLTAAVLIKETLSNQSLIVQIVTHLTRTYQMYVVNCDKMCKYIMLTDHITHQ